MIKAGVEVLANIGILLDKLGGEHDEIAKVNGVRFLKQLLVDFVDSGKFESLLCVLDRLIRRGRSSAASASVRYIAGEISCPCSGKSS